MLSLWQKITNQESIWPWIIPLVGVLFLGFTLSRQPKAENISTLAMGGADKQQVGMPKFNVIEANPSQYGAPAQATAYETLPSPAPIEWKKVSELTFAQYKVDDFFIDTLADLDTKSNFTARYFRTMIRSDMELKGVNFAGHYTIAGVGMTGKDTGYWIVDRKTGRAYVFPYRAFCMNFQKDSNLIVINSRDIIADSIQQPADLKEYCDTVIYDGEDEIVNRDYKPSYFLWENNELRLIGPKGSKPEINKFWDNFTPEESGIKL